MIDYNGDDIDIEEFLQGCIISTKLSDDPDCFPEIIEIRTPRDARALIKSLEKMLATFENREY
jgi:hypothetical protein